MKNDPFSVNSAEMEKDIKTNHVGGLVQLDAYANSDINLQGWKMDAVLDDILMVAYADESEDGKTLVRGGIHIPLDMTKAVWRIGKVILSGPNAKVKPGQHVMFPNDKGIQSKNINGFKRVVFLNEQRIFGIVVPQEVS